MRAPFGLTANGPGVVDHMCMFAATGTVQELDAPGFAVIGNAPAVVIAGTGAIGDSKSSSSSCDKTNCYCHFFYILSGTSMPNSFMPLLITFPAAADTCSLNCLDGSSSALSMVISW